MSDPADVAPFPGCSGCGQITAVRVVMLPGTDGRPWYLCPRCFVGTGQKPRLPVRKRK